MKYFKDVQIYIISVLICVHCKLQNQIDTENDTICSIIESEDDYNNVDSSNTVNNENLKSKRNNFVYPPANKKNWVSDRRLSVSLRSVKSYTTESNLDGRKSSSENNSLENYVSKVALNEIIQSGNTTTIESATWTYQDIRSDEESDEAKTTLIDYPFSVSLQRKGAHYTTGALLNKLWIITSAGDFFNVRESIKLFRARLGSVDCKRGGMIVPIKKIEIHPYYLQGKPNFDVALLRMAYDVQFTDYIRPIAISNINGKLISARFMTTYWPRILHKGLTLPFSARERIKYNSMRVSMQRLMPDHKCSIIMSNFSLTLNEASLCLKPVITHHSVCKPDPGAPVIAEDGLWGITSGWISPKCPQIPAPTLFTRISSPSVRSWLDKELLSL